MSAPKIPSHFRKKKKLGKKNVLIEATFFDEVCDSQNLFTDLYHVGRSFWRKIKEMAVHQVEDKHYSKFSWKLLLHFYVTSKLARTEGIK